MPETAVVPAQKPLLQPASALLMLAVDWLAFGGEFFTLGASVLVTSIAAFAITTLGVFFVQRKRAGDRVMLAAIKAVLLGMIAGVPTSLGGTAVGAIVLAAAGLRRGSLRSDAKTP
jgi:hypothetical protein